MRREDDCKVTTILACPPIVKELLATSVVRAALEKTFGLGFPYVISNFYLRFRVSKGS